MATGHRHDLNDSQWAVLNPLIPEPSRRKDGRGRPSYFPAQKSELHFLIEPSSFRRPALRCSHRPIDELYVWGMLRDPRKNCGSYFGDWSSLVTVVESDTQGASLALFLGVRRAFSTRPILMRLSAM